MHAPTDSGRQGKKAQLTLEMVNSISREFPGSSVVRTPFSHCQGLGSIPGGGTKISQAESPVSKKKKKNHFEKVQDKQWLPNSSGESSLPLPELVSLAENCVYYLTILEARSLKSRCWQGQAPSGASRGGFFFAFASF